MTLYDEMLAQKKKLEEERAAIDERTAPLYKELKGVQDQEEKARIRIKEIYAEIKKLEQPRRAEISRDLAIIARATSRAKDIGGKS